MLRQCNLPKKNNNNGTEKVGSYKQHKPYLICT